MQNNEFLPGELDAAIMAYHIHGFCVIKGVLSVTDRAGLKGLVAEIQAKADRGEGEDQWFSDETAWEKGNSGRRIVRKVPKPFKNSSLFRQIFSRTSMLDLVEAFIGPEIYLHSSKMLLKPAYIGRPKPLHQDLAYWEEMQARQVTLWCAIDESTKDNGCIEILPGAHRNGMMPHIQLDDWQIARDAVHDEPLAVAMAAGDALFLHPLAPHASRANISGAERLAAIVNYYAEPVSLGSGARYGSEIPLRRAGSTL